MLLALVLAIGISSAPLPEPIAAWRPDIVLLVAIYMAIHQPQRMVISAAVITGLILDTQQGTPLGQYALAHTIAVYLPLRLHQRLLMVPVWQSTLSVILFTAIGQFVLFWCNGATDNNIGAWAYLKPLASNALFWPPVMLMLDALRIGKARAT